MHQMDNHGIPARINSRLSQVRRYVALQDPSEGWPFGGICDYTCTMNLPCGVPVTNRRGKQIVEAPEPSTRMNTEAENAADENNRETPIVISSGSEGEDDSEDDAGNIGNDSAINPVMELPNVSHCPNEGTQVEDGVRAYEEARRRKGKMVVSASKAEAKPKGKPAAPEVPSGIMIREQQNGTFIERESDSETDSEDDAAIEHRRQLNVPIQESLNKQNGEAPESSTRREAENLLDENNLGAEYDIELNVAILESLNTHSLKREHERLKEGVAGSESVAAEGNIGNNSASNHVMELANLSHCPNEDSNDEGAQVEALEADTGKFISNVEPTESMPRPPVSSRGRTLKPTVKQLELLNATGAPLPSKRKRKAGASIDGQTKQKAVKPTPAVPRFNEGDITLNRRPRGFLGQQGVTDVSEPRGPGSVLGQASLANGMAHQADGVNPNGSVAGVEVGVPEPSGSGSFVGQASLANGMAHQADVVNPNGSGAGVEVGVSEPSGSGSLWGQASEVNEVGRQMDMAAPILEPMVCVTNRNPMDLTIEEASAYMRSEGRVSSAQKVKLFGTYIS